MTEESEVEETNELIQMSDHLSRLRNNKKNLTEKSLKLKEKINDFSEKVDRKKSRISSQADARKLTAQVVAQLRDRLMIAKQSVQRIEGNNNKSRDSVQQFNPKSDNKREDQSVVMDDISSQMDSLTEQFIQLTTDSFSEPEVRQIIERRDHSKDQIEAQEVDQQIKSLVTKRNSLTQELNQLKDESESVSSDTIEEPETGSDEWPIEDRIRAHELFVDENLLLNEDLELLKRLE